MTWRIEEILTATRGVILHDRKKRIFAEVVTDSAKVKKDSVFVALKGERFDGHRFVQDAIAHGAGCVIVHRRLRHVGGATVVQVKDTLRALGDLAHYRRQKVGPKVLAITGSNGKTTTKEMLAAIVEEASLDGKLLRGRVLKTEGNLNNLVGLPQTLLRLRKKDRVAVVELGTNRPGEIERLAQIADPDMGIITSVAAAHLEGLNSLAGVAKEKGALYSGVRPEGMIAVNLDDFWVRRVATNFKGDRITYGKRGQLRAESRRLLGPRGMEFRLRADKASCKVRLNFLGEHNITNALGAAAMAFGMGANLAAIRRGLEKAKPFRMRMQIEDWNGVGIINDAYNANPASMEAALKTLAEINCRGSRFAVLGDMFELGKQSQKKHRELGKQAAHAGVDGLYLLGPQAAAVRQGALQAGMPADAVIIGDHHRDLANQLRGRIKKGDWLLFKGSRGMSMEKVLTELQQE